ncbi:hypothetical protein QTO34_003071 [Cnephaeus nilssonii]|uniref:Testis-expressed protein 51 n=1 Tax=Cnephaeus nilssonii TaxID=3371016 RepID=A0AA40HU85_CNENI|nr:hypothetical protein QTO34_003071 [Eptesicus nilssonii]
MLLVLLGCLLPAAGAGGESCLRCWPELPLLMDYDLQVLWGPPGPPRELSRSLQALLLQAPVLPEPRYLGQDQLEREAAELFDHIDRAIGKFRADKPSLLNEIHVQKQLFAERLSKASEELKEQALPFKLEVISCVNCRAHLLTCRDPTLCPGGTSEIPQVHMSRCRTTERPVPDASLGRKASRLRQAQPSPPPDLLFPGALLANGPALRAQPPEPEIALPFPSHGTIKSYEIIVNFHSNIHPLLRASSPLTRIMTTPSRLEPADSPVGCEPLHYSVPGSRSWRDPAGCLSPRAEQGSPRCQEAPPRTPCTAR